MEFTKFTDDLKIIQKLDDKPNQMDGLNADQMKAKFDEAGISVQNYLNNILLVELSKKVAPSGYGLGGDSRWINAGEYLSTYTSTGFYSWSGNNPDAPFDKGSMIVVKRSDTYGYQIAFLDDTLTPSIAVRKSTDGVWCAWEWLNPPMVLGVEYRTTERWNGSAVYVKALDFGALPNASYKTAAATDPHCRLIRFDGCMVSTSTSATVPLTTINFISDITLDFNSGYLVITTTSDASGFHGYPIIYYTKQ